MQGCRHFRPLPHGNAATPRGAHAQRAASFLPGWFPAVNVIGGSRVFWAVIILFVYLAIKAPMTLSDVLNAIGHVIANVGSGITHFLTSLTSKSS